MGVTANSPNPDQQRAIDARENVVVSAGAGSGKTGVLSQRYLSIIENGESTVDRILTLTFTRKAAAEMFSRIYRGMTELADENDEIASRLERMDQAPISTLDAFAARIVRDAAWFLGINPLFTPDQKAVRREVERIAHLFVSEEATNTALERLLTGRGFSAVIDSIFVPLGIDHIRLSSSIDFLQMHHRQMEALDGWIATDRAGLSEHLRSIQNSSVDTPAVQKRKRLIRDAGGDPERQIEVARGFTLRGLTTDTPEKADLRGYISAAREASIRLEGCLATIGREDEYRELAVLLNRYRDRLMVERRMAGDLSYGEVFEYAVKALTESRELRSRYKRAFDYVMIDEFQDNNALQRDLLFLLSERYDLDTPGVPAVPDLEPKKLFFVGDQKQSIYRFRGADVSVFKHLSEVFPVLSLSRNYRSEPRLIAFFNDLFPRVFLPSDRDYEAIYESLEPRESREDAVPEIELALVMEPKEREKEYLYDERAEATWIANRIAARIDEGTPPSEIAILLRTGSRQHTFEQALRKRGIPFHSQSPRSLFLESPAADIYSLLETIVYPDDRAAYAALLRSPLVGVSDEALVKILLSSGTTSGIAPFSPVDLESPLDRELYEQGRRAYECVSALLDVQPPAVVLDTIWYDLGYRYALLSRSRYHGFLEHYDYLMEFAMNFSDRPAIEWIDEFRSLLGESNRLEEIEDSTGTGVQIMTIHKSKGLQFEAVFVAAVGAQTTKKPSLLRLHPELGITISIRNEEGESSNVFVNQSRDEEKARQLAELRRLLYVAATRAISTLVFTGRYTGKIGEDSILSLLWEGLRCRVGRWAVASEPSATTTPVAPAPPTIAVGEEFVSAVRVTEIRPITEKEWITLHDPGVRRRREDVIRDILPAEVVVRRPVETDISPSELSVFTADDPSGGSATKGVDGIGAQYPLTFGTLCHELLEEAFSSGGTAGADIRPSDYLCDRLKARLPADVPESDREPLITEASDLVREFLSSTDWTAFFSPFSGHPRRVEMPFLYHLPGETDPSEESYFSGQADLVVFSPLETLVIDFKTDTEINPADHRTQLGIYRLALEAITGNPVRTLLAYLRFDTIVSVDDLPGETEIRGYVGAFRRNMIPYEGD